MCHRHCQQLVPLKQAIWSYVTCHYNAYQNLSHRHDEIIWFWDPRHYREPCFRCNGRSMIWRKTRTLRILQVLHKKRSSKQHTRLGFVVIVLTSICNSSLSNSSISSCTYNRRFQRFAICSVWKQICKQQIWRKKTTLNQELITASKCRCIPSASLSTKGGGGRTFTGAAWAIGILGWMTDWLLAAKKTTPLARKRAKYLGSKFHDPKTSQIRKSCPKHTQLQKVLAWEVFSQTYQNVKISMFFNHKEILLQNIIRHDPQPTRTWILRSWSRQSQLTCRCHGHLWGLELFHTWVFVVKGNGKLKILIGSLCDTLLSPFYGLRLS